MERSRNMGIRGELFSTKVSLQNRTYFFNVKENRMGDLYLNIVESKNRETGGFERQSVILFAEDLPEFLKGFDESLRIMEKAVKDKKRTGFRPPPAETAAREGRERNGRESPERAGSPDRERNGPGSGGAKQDSPGGREGGRGAKRVLIRKGTGSYRP
jgi:hypothetical protein